GSQSGSASRAAKRGLIASIASAGEVARAICSRTTSTKPRTTGVSSTNSSTSTMRKLTGQARDDDVEDPIRASVQVFGCRKLDGVGDQGGAVRAHAEEVCLLERLVEEGLGRHRRGRDASLL